MTEAKLVPEPGSAQWLVQQAAAETRVLREAGKIIAEGGRSNDMCLLARRFLEREWDLRVPGPQYRQAADLLDKGGQGRLAEIFSSIAATDTELAAARHAWAARWTTAPANADVLAAQFATGLIETTGVPALGVDGAWYQRAVYRDQALGPGRPGVLVSTMTTRELVTGFGSQQVMDGWLRSRERAAARGPLADPPIEQPPRFVLEERVLAWLIRHPGWLPPDFGNDLRTGLWTADCRHEIDAALRTTGVRDGRAGYSQTVRELRRRTLRTPDWASDLVGWPAGHWVQQYLWRLAATNVSQNAARDAFQTLIAAPSVTGPAAGITPGTGPARVWPAPGLPARSASAHDQYAATLYDPVYGRPDSVGTRMRVTRPGPQP
jgi:hypothetical protein